MNRSSRLVAVGLAAAGLFLAALTSPAGASPVRDAAAGLRGAECVAGTSPSEARATRPADGPTYTATQLRRIERRLRDRLAQLGVTATSRAATRLGAVLHIPVHVHVIGAKGSRGPGKGRVRRQLAILDSAYAGGQSAGNALTRFDFYLASFERVRNGEWRDAVIGSQQDVAMRRALHRGGAESLNLYVSKPQSPGSGTVLGWATSPAEARRATFLDGVVIHQGSLPGGGFRGYNRGDTAVHEVGHWLGLFHTFEGGCHGPGDLVDDTPAQSEASSACDVAKDTCLAEAGTDPVHNFMDYSVDACMNSFTPGQVARMQDNWLAYRTP